MKLHTTANEALKMGVGVPSPTNSTTKFLAMVAVGSAVTFACFNLWLYRLHGKSNTERNEDHGHHDSARGSALQAHCEERPSHVQRKLHKEQRRKERAPHLAMKKPLYDNIAMYDPDDVMLCTIGKKKADWYVNKKKLAVWRVSLDGNKDGNNDTATSIRLLFTPSNKKKQLGDTFDSSCNTASIYNTSHKKNICVACGTNTSLMRHYVVPYSYRRLLPTKFKSHLPHDIVLLCMNCHICADQAGLDHQTNVYERQYRTDPQTANPVIPNRYRRHVKSCARALQKHHQQLPPDRISDCESVVEEFLKLHPLKVERKSFFKVDDEKERKITFSSAQLQELTQNLETESPNPKYIPIAVLVVSTLQSDQDVSNFIRSWRKLFLKSLKPRFLPVGWSVTSRVENG
jgi:hypothetical protein